MPPFPLPPSSPLFLLRRGLHDLGYIEGRDIAIETRFVGQRPITDIVAELVQLRVDVIVAMGTPAAWAAKNTTTTAPIVFSAVGDPVELGLVTSLARPGGNLTGTHILSAEQSGKRLDATRGGPAANQADRRALESRGWLWEFRETEAAARALALQVQPVPVRSSDELDAAFKAAVDGRVEGLTVLTTPVLATAQGRIADLSTKNQLPAVYRQGLFAQAGGLMAYGPSGSGQVE